MREEVFRFIIIMHDPTLRVPFSIQSQGVSTQRNLCLSGPIRAGRQFCELPIGMPLCPDRQFNPSRPESVGTCPSWSAILPDKNYRPTRIRADWHWSAKIGSELPTGMPSRPDRQFNAGNPPGSARIGTSFAEYE